MSCQITNKEHFKEAVAFAKSSKGPTRKSFKHCLKCLNRIKRNYNTTLHLQPDFVPHSFTFFFEKNGLLGGFILHGYTETFSVEINPPEYPHWSLHT
jgi:hypothetical protein